MLRSDERRTLRTIDMTGVIPLPPQKATIGRSGSATQKTPAGLVTSSTSPSATSSCSQFEPAPPGTRLTVTTRSSSVSGALDIE